MYVTTIAALARHRRKDNMTLRIKAATCRMAFVGGEIGDLDVGYALADPRDSDLVKSGHMVVHLPDSLRMQLANLIEDTMRKEGRL